MNGTKFFRRPFLTVSCMWLKIWGPISVTIWAYADFSKFQAPLQIKIKTISHSVEFDKENNNFTWAKNKSLTLSSAFTYAVSILSNLFSTECMLLCCGSSQYISLPVIAFRREPRTLSCVCAAANVCLRAKEYKPLCWSPHCAGVTELRSERQEKKGENNDARETQQWIPSPPTLLSTAQQQCTFVMS